MAGAFEGFRVFTGLDVGTFVVGIDVGITDGSPLGCIDVGRLLGKGMVVVGSQVGDTVVYGCLVVL